jgi:hypothetical protein
MTFVNKTIYQYVLLDNRNNNLYTITMSELQSTIENVIFMLFDIYSTDFILMLFCLAKKSKRGFKNQAITS